MNVTLSIIRRSVTTGVLLFAAVCCSAQTLCEKLHDLKQKYYGFSPTGLTKEQIDAKSADLDKFWEMAKTDKAAAAACLSDMILAEKNDTYFCFDAASLLLSLDPKDKYIDAVYAGLQKCRLKELQLEPYLRITHYLGSKGKDISGLTEKLISEPDATVYLARHVITLSVADASLFLYNEMGTQKAEESLLNTLKNGNPTGKSNAALVLSLLSTAKGDSVLNVMMTNQQLPDSVINDIRKEKSGIKTEFEKCDKGNMQRDEVLGHLKDFPGKPGLPDSEIAGHEELICSACKSLTIADVDMIRAARDRSTPGLSDESLYDYMALSAILIYIRSK